MCEGIVVVVYPSMQKHVRSCSADGRSKRFDRRKPSSSLLRLRDFERHSSSQYDIISLDAVPLFRCNADQCPSNCAVGERWGDFDAKEKHALVHRRRQASRPAASRAARDELRL